LNLAAFLFPHPTDSEYFRAHRSDARRAGDLLGGRSGDGAERYLRRHPTAGALLRKLSESNATEDVLRKTLEEAGDLKGKKKEEDE